MPEATRGEDIIPQNMPEAKWGKNIIPQKMPEAKRGEDIIPQEMPEAKRGNAHFQRGALYNHLDCFLSRRQNGATPIFRGVRFTITY